MARYARAKNAYGISDRSGFRYKLRDMRKEWNGSFVGKDEYESKHPQLEPRLGFADAEAIKDARPDRTEPSVSVLLPLNPFKTGTAGTSTITVTEPSHGRSASNTVRFRNVEPFDGITSSDIQNSSGFSIASVVDTDSYTVSVSGTATVGSIKGGGSIASAGPVTLVS
jgi:hypothetical protein|tara:strand:+ start:813 stop:1316 length:504 start_codon:yes stop_codon:yes gene_type:complete